MSDCWKVLDLPPTATHDEIKTRFRELVMKWHPDRVQSPEKKRRYTIRCAELNSAYKEALEQASAKGPAPSPNKAEPAVRPSWWEKAPVIVSSVVGLLLGFGIMVFLAIGLPIIVLGIAPSNPFRIAFELIVSMGGGLIFAVIFTALPDLLAYVLVVKVCAAVGFSRYEAKIWWVTALIVNALLMILGPGQFIGEGSSTAAVYFIIIRVTATFAIPGAAAAAWFSDLIRANRLRPEAAKALIVSNTVK